MVLPILDPQEVQVGVLEIVSYNANSNEVEEKFLADYLSYCLGIAIFQQQREERELWEMSTLKIVFESYFSIIEISSI